MKIWGEGLATASPRHWVPLAFLFAAERWGVPFTDDLLWVSVRRQSVLRLRALRCPCAAHRQRRFPDYIPCQRFRASTSRFGIGQVAGSQRTPLGLHKIAAKVGEGWPVGTVFRGRKPIGYTWKGHPEASITNRILWLEGLEPRLNRGGNVDSFNRYIYVHGTGAEPTLGRPATCGCIHLSADDLIPLCDELPSGTLVWVEP